MIRTAVDSSVLLDVFANDSEHGAESLAALERCWEEGHLLACDIVWAEIRPRFSSDEALLKVTEKISLAFEPMTLPASLMAGMIWNKYRAEGGKRQKMIPDFLIAAHAQTQADRLLTRDRGFHRRYFPRMEILMPG